MPIFDELNELTQEINKPFYVHWELTSDCNLRCSHCYQPRAETYVREEDANLILDCLEENDCLLVTLSGGEPLTHPNFKSIFLKLKERGFFVTVCTNAVLLDNDHVDLFKRYPPYSLEISIYGANKKHFKAVTGRDQFKNFVRALDLLRANSIDFQLKVPLTAKTLIGIDEIEEYAKLLDVPFQVGTLTYPRFDGDQSNLSQRIPVEDVLNYESTNFNEFLEWKKETSRKFKVANGLRCSNAARNSILIDSTSHIAFCGMLRNPKHKFTSKLSFSKALKTAFEFRNILEMHYSNGPCGSCEIADMCLGCPAQSYLHTGFLDRCIPYFKKLAEDRMSIQGN